MILQKEYQIYKSALPSHYCNKIIEYCLRKQQMKGTIGDTQVATNLRDSNVIFNNEYWLKLILSYYINKANKECGWNWNIGFLEDVQFTIYNPGQFYDWHCDSWEKPYDKPNTPLHNQIRKISISIILSNEEDSDGGDFMIMSNKFMNQTVKNIKELNKQGSVLVFPSFMWHKVNKITKGVRYSLVGWNCGDQYI